MIDKPQAITAYVYLIILFLSTNDHCASHAACSIIKCNFFYTYTLLHWSTHIITECDFVEKGCTFVFLRTDDMD